MHELPTEFSIRQWIYTQVSRDGEVAIYRQWRTDAAVERFEVIRVHHKPVQVFPNGTVQEHAGEYYPGSAQWGAAVATSSPSRDRWTTGPTYGAAGTAEHTSCGGLNRKLAQYQSRQRVLPDPTP